METDPLRSALLWVEAEHVRAAADWIDAHCREGAFANLYERTGRAEPRHRYVTYAGNRYPAKAFGYLVAQIASQTEYKDSDLTVNMVTGPLRKFGAQPTA